MGIIITTLVFLGVFMLMRSVQNKVEGKKKETGEALKDGNRKAEEQKKGNPTGIYYFIAIVIIAFIMTILKAAAN